MHCADDRLRFSPHIFLLRINYDREIITIKGLARVKSKHRAGVQTMQLRTRMECIGSLPGLRKGVHRKKTETRRKIVKGSRKACWETSPKVSERLIGTRRRSPEEDYKTRRREC
ncbi:hypothetical protein BHE74_00057263 [Ensete ventricosum]|nr:hypothetical protein BHE74_00057263 [Ensete ventricosum]RZS12103.1 hypothetical protein BHM03_00043492 [Ensete ventricosum]